MKRSAQKKAAKRAANKKTAQQSRVVTPTANAPKVEKAKVAKGKAATGPKPPVDWAAAGRKAWDTRQRNLAAGGAPVKKAKVAKVAPVPDAPITLDEIGDSAAL